MGTERVYYIGTEIKSLQGRHLGKVETHALDPFRTYSVGFSLNLTEPY